MGDGPSPGTLARLNVPENFEPGRTVLTIRDEIGQIQARLGRELPLTAGAVTVLDAVAPKRGLHGHGRRQGREVTDANLRLLQRLRETQ